MTSGLLIFLPGSRYFTNCPSLRLVAIAAGIWCSQLQESKLCLQLQ